MEGVLGHLKMGRGAGAEDLVKYTLRAIREFCTVCHGCPKMAGPQPEVDASLLKHLLTHIEHYAADAEAAEQLAGNMLHGRGRAPSCKELLAPLPNLRIVSRDRAHASRRLQAKPWAADPELKGIMQRMVLGECLHWHLWMVWLVYNNLPMPFASSSGLGGLGDEGGSLLLQAILCILAHFTQLQTMLVGLVYAILAGCDACSFVRWAHLAPLSAASELAMASSLWLCWAIRRALLALPIEVEAQASC